MTDLVMCLVGPKVPSRVSSMEFTQYFLHLAPWKDDLTGHVSSIGRYPVALQDEISHHWGSALAPIASVDEATVSNVPPFRALSSYYFLRYLSLPAICSPSAGFGPKHPAAAAAAMSRSLRQIARPSTFWQCANSTGHGASVLCACAPHDNRM
jgi:hypothetical protein